MSCEQARTIISDLYKSPEINDCINRVVDRGPRDDFKQELFIILLEYPCDKIVEASEQGKIRYFVARIIVNLFNQERNVFQKKIIGKIHMPLYAFGDVNDAEVPNNLRDENKYNHITKYAHREWLAGDGPGFEERSAEEDREEKLIEELEKMDDHTGSFYHRILVNLVAKYGSQREVSRRLGIPKSSISDSIKKVRNILKDKNL